LLLDLADTNVGLYLRDFGDVSIDDLARFVSDRPTSRIYFENRVAIYVTSQRGNTLSMRASNCPRASIPGRAPFLELTMARMAAVIAASSGSSGCIAT
jgi:hypothetical protein